MLRKVVYNACYGGFGLSQRALDWMEAHGVKKGFEYSMERHNPLLVRCIEELGNDANTSFSDLRIAEIEGNLYRIEEYDGYEEVVEPKDMRWIIVQ